MLSTGTVTIGTGNDDLREGSQIWLHIYVRGVAQPAQELAAGRRLADRTTVQFAWSLPQPIAAVQDIDHVEISYVPDRRSGMWDDKWYMTSFVFAVNDGGSSRELYRNDVVGKKFETAGTFTTGILPSYLAIIGALVTVKDEAGGPVSGALVFIDAVLAGSSDGNGQLPLLSIPAPGARILVRKQIHQQTYYRSHHDFEAPDNWNYRVYLTNLVIDPNGVATPSVVRLDPHIAVTVSRSNTLIGMNLLLAVEWDATPAELATFQSTLASASAFLYNATDGQFFMECARICDASAFWDDSDYRCVADLTYRSNVPNLTGGFLGWNVAGSAMRMMRTEDARTFVHELGHFALDVRDEYQDGDATAVCTGNLLTTASPPFQQGSAQSSCIMHQQLIATKICSSHAANPHVKGTRQGDLSCWDKLAQRWSHAPDWQIRTPVDRGNIPGKIVFSDGSTVGSAFLQTRFQIDNGGFPDLIGPYSLSLSSASGAKVSGLVVKLRDPAGRWIMQGQTSSSGTIALVGAHANDRVRIEGLPGSALEGNLPAGTVAATVLLD